MKTASAMRLRFFYVDSLVVAEEISFNILKSFFIVGRQQIN